MNQRNCVRLFNTQKQKAKIKHSNIVTMLVIFTEKIRVALPIYEDLHILEESKHLSEHNKII